MSKKFPAVYGIGAIAAVALSMLSAPANAWSSKKLIIIRDAGGSLQHYSSSTGSVTMSYTTPSPAYGGTNPYWTVDAANPYHAAVCGASASYSDAKLLSFSLNYEGTTNPETTIETFRFVAVGSTTGGGDLSSSTELIQNLSVGYGVYGWLEPMENGYSIDENEGVEIYWNGYATVSLDTLITVDISP